MKSLIVMPVTLSCQGACQDVCQLLVLIGISQVLLRRRFARRACCCRVTMSWLSAVFKQDRSTRITANQFEFLFIHQQSMIVMLVVEWSHALIVIQSDENGPRSFPQFRYEISKEWIFRIYTRILSAHLTARLTMDEAALGQGKLSKVPQVHWWVTRPRQAASDGVLFLLSQSTTFLL